MQAARVHGREDLRLESVPDPAPREGEVVVAVRVACLCSTDLEIYLQDLLWYTSGRARLPITPGHEWSGEVVGVGSGVADLRVGDRVVGEVAIGCGCCRYCLSGRPNICPARAEVGIINHDGAFAERLVMPAALVHSIGDLDFDAAALAEPTTVALRAVHQGGVGSGDRVAVLGAGTIGLLAMQAARVHGAGHILVTDLNERRLALAKELGADSTVNIAQHPLAALDHRHDAEFGFDVVIEAAGNPEAAEDALKIAALDGRIVIAGTFAGEPASLDLDTIVAGELTFRGVVGGQGMWEEAIQLVTKGEIRTTPLITHRLPLAQAQQAFDIMRDRSAGALKIQLEPQPRTD